MNLLLLTMLLVLALPAWAAPFATCELPSDPRITACDYDDAGQVVRLPVEIDQQRGSAPDYRVCKFDISNWVPGSVHTVRCRSVDTATGEVSTWFEATLDRPSSAGLTLALVGGSVVVPPTPATEVTVFGTSSPTQQDTSDTSSVNLGLRFTTSAPGKVLGVRFYKQPGNGGTHVGALWAASSSALAQATFTGETASGWQEIRFQSPVSITPGQTYTVSYLAPQGRYPYTSNAAWPRASAPLSALGGVYVYGGSLARPTQVWQSSNYWVDLIFKQD